MSVCICVFYKKQKQHSTSVISSVRLFKKYLQLQTDEVIFSGMHAVGDFILKMKARPGELAQ